MQPVGATRDKAYRFTVADIFRQPPRLSDLAYHISERENLIHPGPGAL